jgi:hypothetical protein
MRLSNISRLATKCKRSSRPDNIRLDSRFFDHALTAKICLLRARDQLNDYERDFLVNMQFLREPSPKQLALLEALAKKARLDWRAPR